MAMAPLENALWCLPPGELAMAPLENRVGVCPLENALWLWLPLENALWLGLWLPIWCTAMAAPGERAWRHDSPGSGV